MSWLVLNHARFSTQKRWARPLGGVSYIYTYFVSCGSEHARPSYEQVCCVFCFPLELLNKTVLGQFWACNLRVRYDL